MPGVCDNACFHGSERGVVLSSFYEKNLKKVLELPQCEVSTKKTRCLEEVCMKLYSLVILCSLSVFAVDSTVEDQHLEEIRQFFVSATSISPLSSPSDSEHQWVLGYLSPRILYGATPKIRNAAAHAFASYLIKYKRRTRYIHDSFLNIFENVLKHAKSDPANWEGVVYELNQVIRDGLDRLNRRQFEQLSDLKSAIEVYYPNVNSCTQFLRAEGQRQSGGKSLPLLTNSN